jgi:hypothetical protein
MQYPIFPVRQKPQPGLRLWTDLCADGLAYT